MKVERSDARERAGAAGAGRSAPRGEASGEMAGDQARAPAPSIDVHVHLHPERLARAITEVFARDGWHQAHPWDPRQVAESLAAHGVERFCFFSYAHKPGIARSLNAWVAETARRLPAAIPVGTLHAEDRDVLSIADEAIDALGLAGFKLHLSVQRFRADDARLIPVYERVAERGRFLVVHAGTMPYRDAFTGLAGLRAAMERVPTLRVIVAHLGAFDTSGFLALTDRFPNLYLDTTMTLTPRATPYVGIDPATIPTQLLLRYQDRIMFGSDFPIIPYPYDEERRFVAERGLPETVARKILYDNAARFLGLGPSGREPDRP